MLKGKRAGSSMVVLRGMHIGFPMIVDRGMDELSVRCEKCGNLLFESIM